MMRRLSAVILVLYRMELGLSLTLNEYYGSGMVLQRDANNKLWGYGTVDVDMIRMSCETPDGAESKHTYRPVQVTDGVWEVRIQGQPASTVCSIQNDNSTDGGFELTDVVFGDVWICSGQSNMALGMSHIINATQEIAASAAYSDRLRYTVVAQNPQTKEDDNLHMRMSLPWSNADNQDRLKFMSAVCFLFGRRLYDELKVPIGMVGSYWGATPIESWSNQATLDRCGIAAYNRPNNPKWTSSSLWNGMVNPMKRNTVKGFLWYQGEANHGWNRDLYNCTFPAMINDWRNQFADNSATSDSAPFGFVQLSTNELNAERNSFSVIRWHQTADVGYVPNEKLTNVFMATPLDTFDNVGHLHPRYKQIVGERLALSGLHVAYGQEQFPLYGPFPVDLQPSRTKEGETLTIVYDRDFTYSDDEISGFYYCNMAPEECDATETIEHWKEISKGLVIQIDSRTLMVDLRQVEIIEQASIGYIWRESPVEKLLGLPIYSQDEFRLPSPPWKFKIVQPDESIHDV